MEIKAKANYPFDIIQFHLEYFLLMNYELKIFGLKLINRTIDLNLNKDEKNGNEKEQKNKSIISKIMSLKIKDKLNLISNLTKDIPQILKKVKPKYSNINVELGIKNPFLLGVLLGLLSTLKLVLKNLQIHPNFNEKILKVDMAISSDINLITLLIIILKYRFSKKYIELYT